MRCCIIQPNTQFPGLCNVVKINRDLLSNGMRIYQTKWWTTQRTNSRLQDKWPSDAHELVHSQALPLSVLALPFFPRMHTTTCWRPPSGTEAWLSRSFLVSCIYHRAGYCVAVSDCVVLYSWTWVLPHEHNLRDLARHKKRLGCRVSAGRIHFPPWRLLVYADLWSSPLLIPSNPTIFPWDACAFCPSHHPSLAKSPTQ